MKEFPWQRVAVTGGSGRLGRYVVRELAGSCDVTVLDRAVSSDDVDFIACDVRHIDAVRDALRGCQAVVHLAALDDGSVPEEEAYIDVNLRGTWNVLQASEELGIGRVVIASSVAAVGLGDARFPGALPIPVGIELLPCQSYGLTKKVCEEFARTFVRRGSLEVICLRPSLVAQPDITYSMARIAAELDGTPPPPAASGKNWRDLAEDLSMTRAFVTPGDAARAFGAALAASGIAFGIYYVTGPDTCSALPTAQVIEAASGIALDTCNGNPRASAWDLAPASKDLGWEPKVCWADHLADVIAAG